MTDVDPELFYDAARAYRENSEKLATAIRTASASTNGVNGSGSDTIGRTWGASFDAAMDELSEIAYRSSNAVMNIGSLLRQNGINHDTTESASDLNSRDEHGAPTVPVGEARGTYINSIVDFGSVSGGASPKPANWNLVGNRITQGWPNGNGKTLQAVGSTFEKLGRDFVNVNDLPSVEEYALLVDVDAAEISSVIDRCNESRSCTTSVAAVGGDLHRAASEFGEYLTQTQTTIKAVLTSLGRILAILDLYPPRLSEAAEALGMAYTNLAVNNINQLMANLNVTASQTSRYIDAAKAEAGSATPVVKKLLDLVPRSVNPTPARLVNNNRRKGRLAEDRAGIDQNKKADIYIHGRRRIPDEIDTDTNTMREVKNVKKLDATRQLRDMLDYAKEQEPPMKMIIVVDKGRTEIGGGMKQLLAENPGVLSIDDTKHLS